MILLENYGVGLHRCGSFVNLNKQEPIGWHTQIMRHMPYILCGRWRCCLVHQYNCIYCHIHTHVYT